MPHRLRSRLRPGNIETKVPESSLRTSRKRKQSWIHRMYAISALLPLQWSQFVKNPKPLRIWSERLTAKVHGELEDGQRPRSILIRKAQLFVESVIKHCLSLVSSRRCNNHHEARHQREDSISRVNTDAIVPRHCSASWRPLLLVLLSAGYFSPLSLFETSTI